MRKRKHIRLSHQNEGKSQEGFIANDTRRSMNKNEKIIMGILVGGIIVFLALSILVLFSKNKQNNVYKVTDTTTLGPTKKVNLTPYPTIPPIKYQTVQLHSRTFVPDKAEIPKGGFVSFLNIDENAITIEANDQNSTVLNLGSFEPGELKEVTFNSSGTYTYRNKAKPTETGIIIIK